LLLEVRLDATIRFGQKQMLLREILELHPGTAIALDRQVQEPVELLVGGRVVAQGEVVIVDGNYGLRITEILSPQQRIESLGKQR
jgi:flagellar motor switch protein FliN/FliY